MKDKNKHRSGLINARIVICLIGMIVSGYLFFNKLFEYKRAENEYRNVRESVITYIEESEESSDETSDKENSIVQENGNTDDLNPTVDDKSEPVKEKLKQPFKVDFKKLREINDECVGWIYLEAVDLSFPVMHGTDNDYYLTHTLEREWNVCGSIFIEWQNDGDLSDPNTIIYGHNINTGEMFAGTKKYITENAYEISPYFWIMTPNGVYKYKIFSIYEELSNGEQYTLFYGKSKDFLQWAIKMRDKSYFDLGEQEFTMDDKIVTLSTCAGGDYRRIIQGICIASETYEETQSPMPNKILFLHKHEMIVD